MYHEKKKANTATTMAYLDNYSLAGKLHILKRVAYCQGIWILSRQLHTFKTLAYSQDTCRLWRQLQTVKIPILQLQTTTDLFVLVCSVKWRVSQWRLKAPPSWLNKKAQYQVSWRKDIPRSKVSKKQFFLYNSCVSGPKLKVLPLS